MTTTAPLKQVPRAVADVTVGTILATVEIAATPERVFQAISSSEVARWWGSPETYQVTEWTGDVRPGGKWHSQGRSADGSTFSVGGEFVEVAPPHTLVHTWVAPWDGNNVTTVRYRIESIDGGSRVTLRHEGFHGRAESCAGHAEGWERVLGWLGGHLAGGTSSAKKYFFCRLVPPRSTFPADMTPAEVKGMKEHAEYWRGHAARGTAVVFGPVADPKGVWGLGILALDRAEDLRELLEADPVIRAELGLRYETLPLISAIVRS
jgi:uncharacterized protein YndB with AHSA1/START domain